MKKIIIPVLASMAVAFTSCEDNLDIDQKGVTAIENFYQTDEDAEQAMVAAYQGLQWNVCGFGSASIYNPFRFVFNLCGDDMLAAGEFYGDNDFNGAMNEFRYDNGSEVVRNAYEAICYAVYYSNLVVAHFENGLPGKGQTATTKRVVAEARVLSAYLNMMLAIGWNCPPLIDHVFTGSEVPKNASSQKESLLWCAQQCELALNDLTERASTSDKNGAVKVTKGFANAVAGKAYLFAGEYAKAKEALKKVIDSGKYALVDGSKYADLFHIEGDGCEEKVFEINLVKIDDNAWGNTFIQRSTWMEANIWNWRSDHFIANPSANYSSIDGWGGCGVPEAFAKEFIANDGLDSYRLNGTIISIEKIVYELPTGIPEIDKMSLAEKKASNMIGIDKRGLYGQSEYLPLKPVCRIADLLSPGNNCRTNNYIFMRYAEVLLMYAEACVQTGDNASALAVVNQIQKRANSKTLSASVDMDVIKKEKKYELWLEGCRWPDIVRWKDFDGVKQNGQSVPSLYDALNDENPDRESAEGFHWINSDKRFYIRTSHNAKDLGFNVGFKEGKHEYFPFPNTVMTVNPTLKQNPGWE